ncbi:fatty-acid--CoA ligase [Halobacteriales archaeon QS_1_68_20]|nr:MAG: fatty-acid--CoA ligase [Halobacteriales archaeon QS_1_68_20]
MPGGAPQTLRPFLWRAEHLYPETEIVSRTAGGIERYDYAAYADRVAQLANALDEAGVEEGDRVGTVCWNDHWHFETYFAVPNRGSQLHTINPLLPDHHLQYIVENAEDRVLFVDATLLEAVEAAYDPEAFESVEQFVVTGDRVPHTDLEPVVDYESFVEGHPATYDWPDLDEDQPAGMCYTSGTTGKPKGVEYTHQMLWSHTMATLTPQGVPAADDDVVMPVVPMFHVNAWGFPFSMTAAGSKHVYPGPSPDPADLAGLIEQEGVTLTAGVPTVWLGLMEHCKEHEVDLSSLERVVVGGSAAPEAMIRWFDEHDVELLHAWGMTEMSPIGSVAHLKSDLQDADEGTKLDKRTKQGLMVPGLEFRVIDENGEEVEWNSAERRSADSRAAEPRDDGEDFGELWVRGPWVTQEYYRRPEANEADFEDGWLKTGDIVTVDEDGYLKIVDRAKDVIKSGGEWISSVELENAIMAHDGVAEATVIGVPHDRWQERPVAFVVPTDEADRPTVEDEVLAMVREEFPDWWVPDDVMYVDEIPKTATGKFDKKVLREEYDDESLVEGKVPEEAAPEDD